MKTIVMCTGIETFNHYMLGLELDGEWDEGYCYYLGPDTFSDYHSCLGLLLLAGWYYNSKYNKAYLEAIKPALNEQGKKTLRRTQWIG